MKRTITYTLLITCVLLLNSCKTHYSKISCEAENLIVSDGLNVPDSEVVSVYSPFKDIIEKDMARVISVSVTEMAKDRPESNLTNFLADLLLAEGEKVAGKNASQIKPEISYFNYGGIRSSLPLGEITVGDIFELMPFENEMVYLRLGGGQIQEFLNFVAAKGGDSVGGVRFVISGGKAKDVKVGGIPLKNGKQYWLVTNDYVASGGDGLEVFAKRSDFIESGEKIRDVIISYMEGKQEKGEKLSAEKDGRISYE